MLDDKDPQIIAAKLANFKVSLALAFSKSDSTNAADIVTCFTSKTIKFNVPKPDMDVQKKAKREPIVPTQSKRQPA